MKTKIIVVVLQRLYNTVGSRTNLREKFFEKVKRLYIDLIRRYRHVTRPCGRHARGEVDQQQCFAGMESSGRQEQRDRIRGALPKSQ